jgi:hypothetical protein
MTNPKLPVGEDLYREAARAYSNAETIEPGEPVHCDEAEWVTLMAAEPQHRAAVDRVVELTEQRVRAESAAEIKRLRQHILDIDAHATPYGDLPEDPGWVGMYLLTAGALHRALGTIGHGAPNCQAEADLAAMTARAEGAEARAWRAGYHAAVAELQGVYRRTGSPAAQWAGDYLDAQTPYVERRARGAGPETGLSSTETGVQATVEGQDANGPQDGSRGGTP